jgi:hypothetical protein
MVIVTPDFLPTLAVTFEQALFWFPLRWLEIAGNDGDWQMAVRTCTPER